MQTECAVEKEIRLPKKLVGSSLMLVDDTMPLSLIVLDEIMQHAVDFR